MPVKRQDTICLTMIVKNESKVIERCLSSLKDLIDYWVICDTGSTDGTQDIIKAFFARCEINGELHQHVWQDFAYNRSLSMKLAKGHANYIMTLDADEVFKYPPTFEIPKLVADMYMIWTKSGSIEYQRLQLVSDKYDWLYKDVLHEYMDCDDKIPKTRGVLNGIYNVPSSDGARSSDPNKYRKDALRLELAILDNPTHSRYVFYLAQSYRDCNDYDNAIKNYQKRAQMEGYMEETFIAMYEVGLCKMRKKATFEEFAGDLLAAYNFRPTRLESVHKFIRHCRTNGKSYLAYHLFKFLLDRPKLETADGLFVERGVYTWEIYDELGLSAFWCKEYEAGIKIFERILADKRFPDDQLPRLTGALKVCRDRLVGTENDPKLRTIDNNNMEQVFTYIIDNNIWGNLYSGQKYPISTGSGNTEPETKEYRAMLRTLIANNRITSIADVGSGIWEFNHDEFNGMTYIGIDCVKRVVDFNKEHYGGRNRVFIHADILDKKNNIPSVDLCIVKDVLQHISNNAVIQMIRKLEQKAKYVLLVQDCNQDRDDIDIKNGQYRPLSINKFPLKSFEPIQVATYGGKMLSVVGKNRLAFNISVVEKADVEVKPETPVNNIHVERNISMVVSKIDSPTTPIPKGKKVLLAILARNKGHILPYYLDRIDKLIYDKSDIVVYINTNNNSDDTLDILKQWIAKYGANYNKVHFVEHNIGDLAKETTNPHTWNSNRFRHLAQIRNDSMKYAVDTGCDYYFVADCDNLLEPETLQELMEKDKPIIAPMLVSFPETNDMYSNYFVDVDANGYYKDHPDYRKILSRQMQGIFKVPVVHCTYLINTKYIPQLNYIDDTTHHEFVIFSRSARKYNIAQWICNRRNYGCLVHFFNDHLTLEEEQKRVADYFAANPTVFRKIDLTEIRKIDLGQREESPIKTESSQPPAQQINTDISIKKRDTTNVEGEDIRNIFASLQLNLELRLRQLEYKHPAPRTLENMVLSTETKETNNILTEVLIIGDIADYRDRMNKNTINFLNYIKANSTKYKLIYAGLGIDDFRVGMTIDSAIAQYCQSKNPILYFCDIRSVGLLNGVDKYNCSVKIFDYEDSGALIATLITIINHFDYDFVLYKIDGGAIYKNCDTSLIEANCPNARFIRYDHYIDPMIFYDRGLDKKWDVICYGCLDYKCYPFRERLFALLKDKAHTDINALIIDHPGYGADLKHNIVGDELSIRINQSRIAIVTPSILEYFLKKYTEVALSGTCMAGRLPAKNAEKYSGCLIELNEKMSDEEIIAKLKYYLAHESERLALVTRAKQIALENYTYPRGIEVMELILDTAHVYNENVICNGKLLLDWTAPKNDSAADIEMTVALPVLRGEGIIYLALESLKNQTGITFDWELIIYEEDGLSADIIRRYVGKLPRCQRIAHYCLTRNYFLIDKWIEMAMPSISSPSSKVFVMHAVDDYSPPRRLEIHYRHLVAEAQTQPCYLSTQPKGIFYNLATRERIEYDGTTEIKNHLNMAYLMRDMRRIVRVDRNLYIDSHIYTEIRRIQAEDGNGRTQTEKIRFDTDCDGDNWRRGFCTDGANIISPYRQKYYREPTPPFAKTTIDIKQCIPEYIFEYLEKWQSPMSIKI